MEKLKYLLLCLLPLFQLSAVAQNNTPEPDVFRKNIFGARAGININNITGDIGSADLTMRYHLAAFAERRFNEDYSVQAELAYSALGITATDVYGELQLNYLQLQVVGKDYPAEKLQILLGGYAGYLLNAQGVINDEEKDIESNFAKTDAGLVIGLEFRGMHHTLIGARFMQGLTNILDAPGSDAKWLNQSVQVSAGFFF